MSRIVDATGLSERLAEVIEEYSEANPVTVAEVMDALEYVYACVERSTTEDQPCHKMH